MNLIESFKELSASSPVVATLLGMYGLGLITFVLRAVPRAIGAFLYRQLTTTLVITSRNESYHRSLGWFEEYFKNKKFRTIKLSNGMWGTDSTVKSIGYGRHWIWFNRVLLRITLTKEDANQTAEDKEVLTIVKLGRGHAVLDALVREFDKDADRENTTQIYKAQESGWWSFARNQRKRRMESVFIAGTVETSLVERLDRFLSKEAWYEEKGIPYQLGILLYGPPGTGKTSLIRAIASYLEYNIYYLPASGLQDVEKMVSRLPEKTLLVIEDIDSNYLTHGRMEEQEEEWKPSAALKASLGKITDEPVKEKPVAKWASVGLSDLLNSLDGMFSAHGRILVATTNHISKLDKALIRPGRIDMKLEIGYVDVEVLSKFLIAFFPEYELPAGRLEVIDKLTMATLQDWVLREMSPEEIVERACVAKRGALVVA